MGKTKTAVISGAPDEKVSGEEKYKAKQAQKESQSAQAGKKTVIKGVGLKGGERVSTVEGGPILEEKTSTDDAPKKVKVVKQRGKKIIALKTKIDRSKLYNLPEAIELVKKTSYTNFDGTIELHGTVKKSGLSVSVELPYSFGKSKKIEVADDKTVTKLEKGKVDFDVLLATPEMMPKLVPFAKLLGPKGLMPNPKNGTLIKDTKSAKNFSAEKLTIKAEKKTPLIHVSVGKVSQKDKEILANLEAVIKAMGPRQLVKANLCATMSPSVKLKIQ
ncbi:hypothetical protein ACFL2C_04180 [Patescibacteria group bacterium]